MSELFTQGTVGGAAGNCCLYPARRITTLPLIEIGCACGVAFALKAHSPARNRLIVGVRQFGAGQILA
ncbi:MAG: hypothetical protein GY797_22290 [Deltaproteobacteria bacterium]|nr:hypothetical protein [Deltaproteobacteria bacterium]